MARKPEWHWVAPPDWPKAPRGFHPGPYWRPDPEWPPAPRGHQFWQWRVPQRTWRRRSVVAALFVTAATSGLVALSWVIDEWGSPIYGPNACNGSSGNDYIEDALIDSFPKGSLRSYMNTGPDCDDRQTGSVAAAWSPSARPASIVDDLVRNGWSRVDPVDGPPVWYVANAPGDRPERCLSQLPGAWQQPGRTQYPTPSCSGPEAEQIVLTANRGPRVFVARFGPNGLTVDAAHKRDPDGVREIRAGALQDPD